jgi:bis(5'-nucleosyl)-tetraphosphatase (symmetrical)
MATYAVGDLQGCAEEFQALLDALSFDPAHDRLWLVGDLVNRGPQSLETLRNVRALGEAAITVLGNHDLHLLAVAHTQRRSKSQDTLEAVLQASDREELLHWLRHRPLLHHDPQLGYTLIHAGLAPQWDLEQATACAREVESALRTDRYLPFLENMYGDEPRRWSEQLTGWPRLRFIVNCLTRLRLCTQDGFIEARHKGAPVDAPAGLMPWFKVPSRRSQSLRVVCGHWSALGYHNSDGVLSIDTGCVWGGSLCAVRLDAPAASPLFIPCRSSGLSIGGET